MCLSNESYPLRVGHDDQNLSTTETAKTHIELPESSVCVSGGGSSVSESFRVSVSAYMSVCLPAGLYNIISSCVSVTGRAEILTSSVNPFQNIAYVFAIIKFQIAL